MRKLNKIGDEKRSVFGSLMRVVGYRNIQDIDVYFEEYDYTAKNVRYQHFKSGRIKCPYEPRVCGKGYLGEGKYSCVTDKKCYSYWVGMISRCYNPKSIEKYPTYIGCEVCEEWLNFQNFAEWYYKNYYEIEDKTMCLDKDILVKGNKIYSPSTCIFVPNEINLIFVKNNSKRGNLPIGVSWNKICNKYTAQCCDGYRKIILLGYFDNIDEAFSSYKQFKEKTIKKMADEYKPYIPSRLYKAMYEYEVEMDD